MKRKWKSAAAILMSAAVFCTSMPAVLAQTGETKAPLQESGETVKEGAKRTEPENGNGISQEESGNVQKDENTDGQAQDMGTQQDGSADSPENTGNAEAQNAEQTAGTNAMDQVQEAEEKNSDGYKVPETEAGVMAEAEENAEKQIDNTTIGYRVHVQNDGWQDWKSNGEMAGTSRESKRLEAIELKLENQKYSGNIEYRVHVQDTGWQDWKSNGETAGTSRKSKRLEAIQIRLTGEAAEHYDIYYRVHVQNAGWLPYVKNGAYAGTEGFAWRMESIEIRLIEKGGQTIQTGQGFYKNVLYYSGHVQDYGNTAEIKSPGTVGTVGKKKRMEGISIRTKGLEGFADGGIQYNVHVQNIGWQGWKADGAYAGTQGKKLQIEAVQIKLQGKLAQIFDIYYRAHVQEYGWLDWAKNGATAGTTGYSYRIEALQIQLVPKTMGVSGTARPYLKKYTANELSYSGHVQDIGNLSKVKGGSTLGTVGKSKRLEAFAIYLNDEAEGLPKGSVQYRAHVQDIGWQGWKSEGTLAGTTGQKKQIEAVQIQLTGDIAKYYDIYYRVHSAEFGWLGWTKNGATAGTTNLSLRAEALQIILVSKMDNQKVYQTGQAYYNTYRYQNPKQYIQIKHVQKKLSGGGYNLSSGYMGLKVWYVQKKLGLSGRRAIMDSTTINAVKRFQRSHGLPANGVVDLKTWKAMGYSESAWNNLGAYASPLKTSPASTRQDCIEAMISTAYQYLGNPYIIGASGDANHGLDCSGLVMQALYSAGIDPAPVSPIRHSKPGYEYECRNLWNLPMKHVPYSQRQRGDLIFYKSANGTIIHVAIYLGNNQVIESWPNKVVVWPVQNSHRSLIAGVARPFV